MIVELLIIFLAWAAIGAVITLTFGLPLYWSVPLAVALLILYDLIIPHERKTSAQPERITVNDFIPFLQNISIFILVVLFDIGINLFTIYIESGGAKLAFPNFKWPKEIVALLALAGIPSNYLNPPTVYGVSSALFLFLCTLTVIRYAFGFIGAMQRALIRKAQNRDTKETAEELYSLIQPAVVAIVIAIITYGVLFPWMAKLASLQIAKTIWPADFQSVYQGEEIRAIQQATPDLSIILQRHDGEFMKAVVTGFPYIMLAMHLIAGILTEVYLLHTQSNLGRFEARHAELISRIRLQIAGLFRFRRNRLTAGNSAQRDDNRDNGASATVTPTAYAVQEESLAESGSEQNSCNNGRNDGNGSGNGRHNEPAADDVRPEEQSLRVIGGGETVTLRTARAYPEIYIVEEERDPETDETSYRVYTKEFYEKLQRNGRN